MKGGDHVAPFSFGVTRGDDRRGYSTEVPMSVEITPPQADINNKNITQLIYGLYAASIIFGVTWLVAIILNYAKRDDVAGTIYESHFRWQMRTFWFTVLWFVIGWATVWIFIGFLVWAAATIWYIYRIVKGWLNLTEAKPMYPA
jgi:uncharacterized membrane protein